jgi:hypothetical protein
MATADDHLPHYSVITQNMTCKIEAAAQTVMGKLVPELYLISISSVVYKPVHEIQSHNNQPNYIPSTF